MRKGVALSLLIGICLLVAGVRLFFGIQQPTVNYESYFEIRQIDAIEKTGIPLYNDPLSYGGRVFIFAPLFEYLCALIALFAGTILAAKIVMTLCMIGACVLVYLIVVKLIGNEKIGLISALLTAFLPICMSTVYEVTSTALALTLGLWLIYYFIDLSTNDITLILVVMLLLVLTNPITLVIILCLLLYLLLSKVEGFTPNKRELELILFFSFLAFWANIILYKKGLFVHGLNIFSSNAPKLAAEKTLLNLTFFETFGYLGILALILGIYGTYLALTKQKSKNSILLVSSILIFGISLLLKIVPVVSGMLFIGVMLCILSAYAIKDLHEILTRSKIAKYTFFFIIAFWILMIGLNLIPSILIGMDRSNLPGKSDVEAMQWIAQNSDQNTTVVGLPKEGEMISYYSERKNVMDSNYLTFNLIDQRYEDILTIYSTPFQTTAFPFLKYYNIDFIFVSSYTKQLLNISTLKISDTTCLRSVYQKNATVYQVVCT